MRHRISGRHLGRDTAHRRSLFRNLVTDLLNYERITTTEAKAKEIRPIAERIITLGRKGDLHSRRQALRFVFDQKVVGKVFDEIGPRMKDRPGGYLRITSLEPRKGDGARMASIELVDFVDAPATQRPQRVTAPASVGAPATAAVPSPAAAPATPAEADESETPAEAESEDAVAEAPAEASEASSESADSVSGSSDASASEDDADDSDAADAEEKQS